VRIILDKKFRAIVQLATLTGLIKRMLLVAPTPATKEDLIQYHTEVYITFLQKISENLEKKSLECCRNASESCSDLIIEDKAMYELFGLVDECPPFYGIWQWVTLVAGGSLTAARLLIKENVPLLRRCNSLQTLTASQRQQGPHTVFHWLGGRHHAKREEARGFCYVNDVVLCILRLLRDFCRVMYIDIDIHHGDGVEEAFYFTNRVLTIDFHRYESGFFPGTGALDSVGQGPGQFYKINVPLGEGITDEQYVSLFKNITGAAFVRYQPEVIVLLCGADMLQGDPLGGFNITLKGIEEIVRFLDDLRTCHRSSPYPEQYKIPMLVLGGGGYNLRNTVNLATLLMVSLLDKNSQGECSLEKPPNLDFYNSFVTEKLPPSSYVSNPNRNSFEYLEKITKEILSNITNIKPN
jgi:acetoin utilization deacetylase AcuC-like enzyme